MKRLITADIHLSGYQSDLIIEKSGLAQRLHNIMESLKIMGNYCRNNNIKHFDIAGDLINDKDVIYTDAQNAFKDFLIEYSDIEFTILSGNHDLSSTGVHQSSAVSAFDGYHNVNCIIEPCKIGNIHYLPYTNLLFDQIKKLEINDDENSILISHFGLNEAMLQNGLSISTNIKISDLRRFKLVILGHYHKPQHISSNSCTDVWYTGNPVHLSWNDKNEQKRFLIYDDETLEVESVDITGLTEYHEFVIETLGESKDIIKMAEECKAKGNYVRIRKKIKIDTISAEDIIMIDPVDDADITNRGVELTQTDEVKLNTYLDIKEIPEEEKSDYIDLLHDCEII